MSMEGANSLNCPAFFGRKCLQSGRNLSGGEPEHHFFPACERKNFDFSRHQKSARLTFPRTAGTAVSNATSSVRQLVREYDKRLRQHCAKSSLRRKRTTKTTFPVERRGGELLA
jgi:hypothetical protein